MNSNVLDLQFFTEGGAANPAAAPESVGGGGSEAAETMNAGQMEYSVGDTLPDGQVIKSAKVAAELNRQLERHPELRAAYGQRRDVKQAPAAVQNVQPQVKPAEAQQQPELTLQQKWDAAKKGEFKDLYGQDVQAAIQDRFKNQKDAKAQLDAIQPALEALMKKAGVDSVEELTKIILDDDSFYEEEAEAMGMTVERYKEYKALKDEHERREREDQENIERTYWDNHFAKLTEQAEQLKKTFPNFNLKAEMQNPTFQRLTHPSVGLSVEDAYYAVHRQELEPQIMAYGMSAARQKLSQTIQAQRARPVEGAMGGKPQPAGKVESDFSKWTRQERDEYRRRVHAGQEKGGHFA